MRLFHATPKRNLASINKRGLLTAKSKGKLPAVWLHSSSKREWATLHTMKRHGAKEVAILGVSVSRQTLRRAGRGLWYSTVDVPPGRLTVEDNHERDERDV
jgi:hypothetical protein